MFTQFLVESGFRREERRATFFFHPPLCIVVRNKEKESYLQVYLQLKASKPSIVNQSYKRRSFQTDKIWESQMAVQYVVLSMHGGMEEKMERPQSFMLPACRSNLYSAPITTAAILLAAMKRLHLKEMTSSPVSLSFPWFGPAQPVPALNCE